MKEMFLICALLSLACGLSVPIDSNLAPNYGITTPTPLLTPTLSPAFTPNPTITTTPAPSATPFVVVQTGYANGWLNLRSCAGLDCPVLGVVQEGQALRLLGSQTNALGAVWLHVDAGGLTGWVSRSFCTTIQGE